MAIDAKNYGKLAGYSSGGAKEAGPFTKIFISGEQRDDQDIRKMHAIVQSKWDSKDLSEKFIVHNADKVNFIIMFIKKIRVKKEQLGKDYPEITYYSYDPDNESTFPEGAKCEFIFAGALLDENYKPILDRDDPTRTALVWFQNAGMRVGPAVEYLGELGKKSSELQPLSNDKDFERNIVTPRRWITQVTIESRKSNYGNKDVYKYEAIKQLPDKNVEAIMDRCMKWVDPFDLQFDLSKSVGGPQKSSGGSSYPPDNDNPTFGSEAEAETGAEVASTIDIPAEDIDLGI